MQGFIGNIFRMLSHLQAAGVGTDLDASGAGLTRN